MKKIKFILIYSVIVIYTLLIQASYAAFAGETSAPELYNKICDIMKIDESNPQKPVKNIDIAIDYAVEILNKWPESIEAYFTLNHVSKYFIVFDDNAVNKCIEWKKTFFRDSDQTALRTAEILIYGSIFLCHSLSPNVAARSVTKEEILLVSSSIENISVASPIQYYRELAYFLLIDSIEKRNIFINLFPNNPVIPHFLINNLNSLLIGKKYQKCIDETLKLLRDYNNIRMPGNKGNFKIECYCYLAEAYYGLEDCQNALKYLNMIAEIDKEYYSSVHVTQLLERIKIKEKHLDALKNRPKDLKDQPEKK